MGLKLAQLGGSSLQPSQLFVSHENSLPCLLRKCRRSWLAGGGGGGTSSMQVTVQSGTSLLHINRALFFF